MNYPKTKKQDIVEQFFGVAVEDPYRWLENQEDPEVDAWVSLQAELTEKYLSEIPYRDGIKKRLSELYNYDKYSELFTRGGRIFYSVTEGLNNQPIFYCVNSEEIFNSNCKCGDSDLSNAPSKKVIINPNALSEDGTTAIYVGGLSKDGKYMAVLISESGSDWHVVRVVDVATGKMLDDELKNVKFTSAAWYGDGFFYSRYDIPDSKRDLSSVNSAQSVYYHKLGESQEKDVLIYVDHENPLMYVHLISTDNEKHQLLVISKGTGASEIRYRPAAIGGDFKVIVPGFDVDYNYIGCEGDDLYFATNDGASNMKIAAYNAENEKFRDVLPESGDYIDSAVYDGGKILLNVSRDAVSALKLYDVKSGITSDIKLPFVGSIHFVDMDAERGFALFSASSFLLPVHHYIVDLKNLSLRPVGSPELNFDPSQYITEQVFFRSKDGTKVPMFVTHKKGIPMDGSNPAFIYGYGGFSISITPAFAPSNIQMLEHGIVHAVVNLRGGLEYGENWHKAGMKFNKQNVFDDMIAGSEALISMGYTKPERLAINGRSNGGLLVGAVVNQRPDLYAVSLPGVGVLDMLRFHKFTVGWGWIDEYGSPEIEEEFKYIYKYSPLHNIKNVKYPATMIITSDHDDRVVPAHSFKYGAALQEKAGKCSPVLLRIARGAGHGAGNAASKVIDERADTLAFMLHNFR